jgi:hypothetical protein
MDDRVLHLRRGEALEAWSTGRAKLLVGVQQGSWRLPAGIRCRLGHRIDVVALLDTGADWSVLDGGTARSLRSDLEDLDLEVRLSTRHGVVQGRLHRLTIELLADPGTGEPLTVDATILVAPGWIGPVVLGMSGMLERVRLALDPGDSAMYFGPCG